MSRLRWSEGILAASSLYPATAGAAGGPSRDARRTDGDDAGAVGALRAQPEVASSNPLQQAGEAKLLSPSIVPRKSGQEDFYVQGTGAGLHAALARIEPHRLDPEEAKYAHA